MLDRSVYQPTQWTVANVAHQSVIHLNLFRRSDFYRSNLVLFVIIVLRGHAVAVNPQETAGKQCVRERSMNAALLARSCTPLAGNTRSLVQVEELG